VQGERSRFIQASYWESRYETGGDSGDGSYGKLAEFKAEVLNALVDEFELNSVIELGCGDGNQLALANYSKYLGLDVSQTASDMCREKFGNDSRKPFSSMSDFKHIFADLTLSLDVIFHLVEDDVSDSYMRALFSASSRNVVIYASNTNEQESPKLSHVRHRKFTNWVDNNQSQWSLHRVVENKYPYDESSGLGSPADFYIYRVDSSLDSAV